jgi:hypothetical protein
MEITKKVVKGRKKEYLFKKKVASSIILLTDGGLLRLINLINSLDFENDSEVYFYNKHIYKNEKSYDFTLGLHISAKQIGIFYEFQVLKEI